MPTQSRNKGHHKRPRTAINQGNQKVMKLEYAEFWQTQVRGTDDSEYQTYLACADDGKGVDFTTGKPLKTYDQWLNS
jgi:hypothetical protein